MELMLNSCCFKIDKANAKAMIEGFYKEDKLIHQCIYCLARNKPFPLLITIEKSPTRFELSNIGKTLDADYFTMHYKYVAVLEKEYFIKNNPDTWEKICNNGLFDIWYPIAPFTRFNEAKTDPNQFRLALLRIYEINEEFSSEEIDQRGARFHILNRNDLKVTTKKPVINDEEFERIKKLLEESLKDNNIMTNNPIKQVHPKLILKGSNFKEWMEKMNAAKNK
jgi:hypothetical protein